MTLITDKRGNFLNLLTFIAGVIGIVESSFNWFIVYAQRDEHLKFTDALGDVGFEALVLRDNSALHQIRVCSTSKKVIECIKTTSGTCLSQQ